MVLNQADQYYLKAIDFYPFYFEFVLENLNYALSCDDEHTQSLCLKGQIFMYYIKEYGEAKKCFNKTLETNMHYPDAYKHLSKLYIWLGEYDKAEKLIRFGKTIPGMNQLDLVRNEALILECKGDLRGAKTLLKRASLLAISGSCRSNTKNDLTRVKEKLKILKLNKKKSRRLAKKKK